MLPERYEHEDLEQQGGLGLAETETNRDWWAPARCNELAGTMSGLFLSEELQDIARAKQICALCPVMAECLEGALEPRAGKSGVEGKSVSARVDREGRRIINKKIDVEER